MRAARPPLANATVDVAHRAVRGIPCPQHARHASAANATFAGAEGGGRPRCRCTSAGLALRDAAALHLAIPPYIPLASNNERA